MTIIKQTFSKPAISIEQQIDLLRTNGLIIQDELQIKLALSTISFHRLSAYFYPYQTKQYQPGIRLFKPDINFSHILDLYIFDRQLRLLTLEALEGIEIALRTSLSNELAIKHDPWWYLNAEIFKTDWQTNSLNKPKSKNPQDIFLEELNSICRNIKHNDEINRYYCKYNQPDYPPSWIIMEFLSFGKCTSLFRYLRYHQDKAAISNIFNMHPKIFESTLEPLRYVRNLCAHHSRLWDRWFVYKPRTLDELKAIQCKPGSLKEQLGLLYILHNAITSKSTWKERLFTLFDRYKNLPLDFNLSGFQQNWQEDPFWALEKIIR